MDMNFSKDDQDNQDDVDKLTKGTKEHREACDRFEKAWDALTPEDQAEFSAEVLIALGYDSSPSLPGIALSSVRKMVKVTKIGPDEADIAAAPMRFSFKHKTSRFAGYKANIKKWYRKHRPIYYNPYTFKILWRKLKSKYEFYMTMREINNRIKNEKNEK